jgi:heterodisulfide reductase subunit A
MVKNRHAVVIGGGIAGIASALSLANSGIEVNLIEREPSIGGQALLLCCKAAETCTRCNVCTLPQEMQEVATHPQISILTNSEVEKISGDIGNFRVVIRQKLRFIDAEKCTACGICAEICPAEPNGIKLPSPKAVPYTYIIDKDNCLRFKGKECTICQDNCPMGAIDLGQEAQQVELNADAIIIATGFDVFDAREKALLGYGKYSNVLTALDLEKRFDSEGAIALPTTGEPPQNVAFVQCVGSRDEYIGHGYCSQVCCKYAIRLARLLQYQHPDTKATMFYMDLQTAGKGFAEFYEQGKQTIRFVRGMPSEVVEVSPGELEVKYEDQSQARIVKESYDLVVLSVGIAPRKDSAHIAKISGINLGDFGFFDTKDALDTVGTNVDGVFVAGTCQGPKDISESFAHGVQAATKVIQSLEGI